MTFSVHLCFNSFWRINNTGCVIQTADHDLAEWKFGSAILDRIKREIRPPPPSPRINDESPQKPKRAHFPIIEMGGRGCPNFSFELSKIAILDRIKREIRPPPPPLPPNQWWIAAKTKTRPFSHHFHLNCPRLWSQTKKNKKLLAT